MSDSETSALEQVLIGVPDQEIVNLEAPIRAAQLSADITALNELISDDLLFTGRDGQLRTKAQDTMRTSRVIVQVLEKIYERRTDRVYYQ
jgi:hypothetical protein